MTTLLACTNTYKPAMCINRGKYIVWNIPISKNLLHYDLNSSYRITHTYNFKKKMF